MKIAVIGLGAVGGFIWAQLTLKGRDVTVVVRPERQAQWQKEKIFLRQEKDTPIHGKIAGVLPPVDLCIMALKMNDLPQALEEHKDRIRGAAILCLQNGIGTEEMLAGFFPETQILTGIVLFNVSVDEKKVFRQNLAASLLLGNYFDPQRPVPENVRAVLADCAPVLAVQNIKARKYMKLFLNNYFCLAALLGRSLQETFRHQPIAELAMCLRRETYSVVQSFGQPLADLPGFSRDMLERSLNLDLDRAAREFSQGIQGLSKISFRGSMGESLKRQARTEVDYINGVVVDMARACGLDAPLNAKAVELVHQAEQTKKHMSVAQLRAAFRDCRE